MKNPGPKEIRRVGIALPIGLCLLAFLLTRRHASVIAVRGACGAALVVALACWTAPRSAGYAITRFWLTVTRAVAAAVAQVALAVVYFVVLTPVGWLFRWRHRDALNLERKNEASYWRPHAKIKDASYYRHLF